MSYRLIRCSYEYGFALAVSPPDAGPDDPMARYYRCVAWQLGAQAPNVFHPVSRELALGYFNAQIDSMGFGQTPDCDFDSLDDALAYCMIQRKLTVENLPVPRFFGLLHSAATAAEAVDTYDLHSDDPESVTEFNQLCVDQLLAAQALILHCQSFGDKVIELLRKSK